jgi:hypothetical protein
LGEDLVCVTNDSSLLTEVLQLLNEGSDESAHSIESDSVFVAARSCLSKAPPCWGIRVFDRVVSTKDITSVRNEKTVIGTYDPKAVFIAFEVPKPPSRDIPMWYATGDRAVAEEFLKGWAKVDQGVHQSNGYALVKVICPLQEVKEEAGVQFLGICALLGQGLLL